MESCCQRLAALPGMVQCLRLVPGCRSLRLSKLSRSCSVGHGVFADKGCLGGGILVALSASLKSWQHVLWMQKCE